MRESSRPLDQTRLENERALYRDGYKFLGYIFSYRCESSVIANVHGGAFQGDLSPKICGYVHGGYWGYSESLLQCTK